jgi:hypothetical protein
MNKLYSFFKITFVIYIFLFTVSLLDYDFINIVDFGQSYGITFIFPLILAILFTLCLLLGVSNLLVAQETNHKTKTTKRLMSVPYIVSPVPIVLLILIIQVVKLSTNVAIMAGFYTEGFLMALTIAIVFLVLFIFSIFSIYTYSILWSKTKKTLFSIFQTVMSVALGFIVFIATMVFMAPWGIFF